MKNFIKKNYNLNPKKIYKKNNQYFFFSNSEKIYIIKTKKDKDELNKLFQLSNELYKYNIPVMTFILNNNGEYLCKKDSDSIILLKNNTINDNENITLDDIFKYNINTDIIKEYNIVSEWEKNIDDLENEMTEYNKEFPTIQNSLDYFIGLSENAIQLIKNIKIINDSLGHNLYLNEYNKENYNNPLNIIKTNRMYDISKYLKYKFYFDVINYDELYYVIKNNINDIDNLIFFFSAMLYQDDYFECVKNILNGISEEKELLIYIKNINKYEELLKYIKDNLHNIKYIEDITWLDY